MRKSDTQVGSPPVVDAIKQLIQRAEYLVFDLSYERPNVYYELGYAHGVGNRATDLLLVAATARQYISIPLPYMFDFTRTTQG